MKGEVVPKFAGELPDSVDGNLGGIFEVVEDDGSETSEQELKNGVAADVTGSAGYQYSLIAHKYLMRSVLQRGVVGNLKW